jgi:cyclic beta-1,2-glucan synthetase
MSFAPAFALAAAAALLLIRPAALAVAAPLLAAWFLSPWVAFVVSRPGRAAPPLTDADLLAVRRLARRTWAFFESVLGPDDHWLAPDHVQEEPHPHAARRTSPTNIGLAAAATLAAYDFGYLPASEVGALLSNTFDTLDKLERVRGHFLNWYDTHQLRTLLPRYVSTVDSGNLAGALIAIARGCESLPDQPLLRAADRAGMLDALGLVQDAIRKPGVRSTAGFRVLEQAIDEAMDALPAGGDASRDAVRTLDDFVDRVMPRLELLAADAAESAEHRLTAADLAELRTALVRARHQASTLRAELHTLQPWCTLPDEPPAGATPAPAQSMEVWREFLATLPEGVTLAKTPDVAREILAALPLLSGTLADAGADADEVARWRDAFTVRLETACDRAAGFLEELHSVTRRADTFVNEMEFGFLFDADRQLFHIGYDVESGTLDRSYYDLLASEARLASLLAIARAQVPPEHWLHLARPFARANGRPVMLSWSGTMFEYHLPLIFMRDAAPTLLSFACEAAVREQIAYAKRFGVPWGLSESAYHAVDRHGTYQYRAFGVPSLSLRREKLEHIVIAPYASVLALQRHAHDVARNLVRLAALGGEGRFGMYEAVDFGRNPIRAPSHVVKSYMAHHQAMILLAIDNALHNNVMVDRFHADLRIAAVDYLLLERLPGEVRREPSAPLLVPTRRTHQAGGTVSPWRVESGPQRPAVHVLSNGRWSTLITDRGSGNARWPGHAITRWRADPTVDEDGTWLYVQDVERGSLWSATLRPTGGRADRLEVRFGPHVAEFHRRQGDIITRLSVAVQADADVEVRRLVIANEGRTSRRLAVTTFGEVVLGSHAEDRRHPAFSRLFVESEYVEARRALVFHRRGRSGSGLWLAHALVVDGKRARIAGWDTDRATFIGRTGSPARPAGLVHGPASLARSAGCTLDPIFALSTEIGVPADGRREVVALTAVGVTQHAALEAVERLMSPGHAERAIARAQERTEGLLAELGLSGSQVVMAQALLSAIVYPYHDRRGAGDGLLQRQNALWGLGISGDQPVVVVRASTLDLRDELLDLLRAHAWLARQQVQADLVVCSAHPAGYVDPLADWLRHAVENLHGAGAWQQAGGVFHVPAGRLDPDRSAALDASAALLLELGEERIENQLARTRAVRLRLPVFVPVPSAPLSDLPTEPLPRTERLLLDNGLGGIAPDGREYVIRVRPRVPTPAPWINVIANEEFGFLVSEIGAGFTWSRDSGHRRLTPWYNDPVRNRGGEAVYLRDEETGAVWSATPAPAGADTPWEVRHGAGHTTFLHHGHGLAQRLRLFVAERDPVKFAVLELHNLWPRHRRITVTYFAEWVLGVHRDLHAPHVVTEMMPEARAILARQRFDPAHAGRIAFLSSGEHVHGATADRLEFLGSGGPARPAALSRIGLGEAFGHGLDPCAALQIHVDLAPGERRSVHYLLGDAASREEVFELAARYRSPDAVEAAFQGAHAAWERTLDRVEVSTPDAAMNAMLNRWLPYQALTSRLWARTGFYQSSGAYGFRDQLQDALAFLATRPDITRERIAEAARHQFIEGDVLHWWHPHTNTGVRTRCSDDLLWLPFATAAFVDATGDRTILDVPIPFLNAPPLRDGEHERYDHYDTAGGTSTLHDHCLRALDRSRGRGAHGLPLMGAGDWNDGLDRVGAGGKGESVWLGWFLHTVLEAFARICDTTDAQRAGALRTDAARLQEALERSAWDGDWYRRAYYDDGSPLGTATDAEARIDSISQSWAVLSRAATPERARKAMDAVRRLLLDEENRLLKLLTPAFDRTERDPGYIRAYPPGVRENGGQYTHAAVWAAWAFCALGEGRPGYDLFCMLNPLLRSTTPEETARYRVEPWVVAADIYSVPPLLGRGGWTWYTGSAGWLYRFGVEAVLGLRLRGGHLYVEPAIPAAWPEYTMVYRAGDAEYRIRVENPAGEYEGVEEVRLDGRTLPDLAVPIAANGCHEVVVRLGTKTASRPWSPVLW